MKLNYCSDTDSLYIDLSEQPSVESREISEGIVLDYDVAGNLVGIDIDNASHKVDLKKLTLIDFQRSSRTTQLKAAHSDRWKAADFGVRSRSIRLTISALTERLRPV
jgi:uncharacterized protein YuzE